jgi:hypothetical protein
VDGGDAGPPYQHAHIHICATYYCIMHMPTVHTSTCSHACKMDATRCPHASGATLLVHACTCTPMPTYDAEGHQSERVHCRRAAKAKVTDS